MPTLILEKKDIINTYNKKQQEQCKLYQKYKKIKIQNPTYGYKKISKLLNQPYHKTRWWHSKKHTPTPIQTINWLKNKNLIPLKKDNKNLKLISKIIGTTFGDGGIFENLNGIFLSSSELSSIKEFEKDLEKIFGEEINKNSRIIEGGGYGHSWCYQNTNRNIIRFFQALGAPIGRKSKIELKVPEWIINNNSIQSYFFGSFFGNEIGIPKINRKGTNSLDIGMVCEEELISNRMKFFEGIKIYLKHKCVGVNKIYINKHKDKHIVRLFINLNFDNLMNFYKNVKIYYSENKSKKLTETLNNLKELKLKRFNKLINTENKLTKRNYSEEWTKNNLRLTDKSLNFILNQKSLEKWN